MANLVDEVTEAELVITGWTEHNLTDMDGIKRTTENLAECSMEGHK